MSNCNEDYIRRAFSAYYKTGGTLNPIKDKSTIEKHGILDYVVLRDEDNVLAVYRITLSCILKRLKRYPSSIN